MLLRELMGFGLDILCLVCFLTLVEKKKVFIMRVIDLYCHPGRLITELNEYDYLEAELLVGKKN